ncbi:MAG TPA: hypothetical protein VNM72_13540 [Blastocatellia bacterium]|nr:hypothetical protein [Blastocatellia bacterium]
MMRSGLISVICLCLIFPPSPSARSRRAEVVVATERIVIDGYNEPNTPPNVPIDAQLAQAITDPAARDSDGTINLNKAIALRFYDRNRPDAAPPRSIVVMLPGVAAGANSFAILASDVVTSSGGEIEFWAVDRRTNLLEDATAMITAEMAATREATLAALAAYTDHPAGRGGYIASNPFAVSRFLAEWGLDVHLRDVKAIVDLARSRVGAAGTVFLGGDFLGAAMAQQFAAYNFDGVAGYTLINGLILLDFTLAPAPPSAAVRIDPISDDLYLNGGVVPNDAVFVLKEQAVAGLLNLRQPTRRFDLSATEQAGHEPFIVAALEEPPLMFGAPPRKVPFEPYTFQLIELAAQLILWDKDGTTTIGPPYVPVPATNEAALGMALDDEFQQTIFARWSLGFLAVPPGRTAGDVALKFDDPRAANPNGIFAPRNPGATPHRWASLRDLSAIGLRGTEPTDFGLFARTFLYGSGHTDLATRLPNFLDWFTSQRLILESLGIAVSLDASRFSPAVRAAMMANGGRVLALTENKRVNIPVLALRAGQGLVQRAAIFSGEAIFTLLLNAYRASTSIPSNQLKVKADKFPNFAHGDLITSREKGTEGKSVADYIVDFVTGRL